VTERRAEKKPTRRAVDLCAGLRLGRKAQALLGPELRPGDYLRLLVENKQFVDAIRFMARALPRRQRVWWVCLCVRHTARMPLPAPEAGALRAAVQWVLKPDEDQARLAKAAAAAAGLKTAAGCAARAAALANADKPAVAAKVAGAAVLLAVAQSKAAERSRTYQQYLSVGLDVSHGVARWDAKRPDLSQSSGERL
jgi:hypothetical protein